MLAYCVAVRSNFRVPVADLVLYLLSCLDGLFVLIGVDDMKGRMLLTVELLIGARARQNAKPCVCWRLTSQSTTKLLWDELCGGYPSLPVQASPIIIHQATYPYLHTDYYHRWPPCITVIKAVQRFLETIFLQLSTWCHETLDNSTRCAQWKGSPNNGHLMCSVERDTRYIYLGSIVLGTSLMFGSV
jgi:hypothetical protein